MVADARTVPAALVLPLSLLPFVVGILWGMAFPLNPSLLGAICAASLLAWGGAAAARWRRTVFVSAVATLFLIGAGLSSIRLHRSAQPALVRWAGEPCRIEGEVSGLPVRFRGGERVVMACRRILIKEDLYQVDGRAALWIWGDEADHRPGDLLRVETTLVRPPGARFPGDRDRRLELAGEGIHLEASVEAGPRCLAVGGTVPLGWRPVLLFRDRVRRLLDGLREPSRGVLTALILGDGRRLDQLTVESFRRSGLVHILSISGLHIGIFGVITFAAAVYLLRRCRWVTCRTDARRVAALAAFPLMIFYTVATGAEVPAVRSCCMAGAFFLALCFGRGARPLVSLALSAAVITAIQPTAVLSPSFLLSFLATFGLLAAMSRHGHLFGRRPEESLGRRFLNALRGQLAVSTAAFVWTLPMALHLFGTAAPLGVAANIAAVPLFSFMVLPFGLLAGAISLVSFPAAGWLVLPAAWGAWLMVGVAEGFARLSWAQPRLNPSPAQVAALYLVLLGITARRKSRRAALSFFIGGLVLLVIAAAGRHALEKAWPARISFLDVGQGDSSLVESYGRRFLVDAGGRFGDIDRGRTVVVPCLRAKGIRFLEAVIISHEHPDHMGGLAAVLDNVEVGTIYGPFRADGRHVLTLADGRSIPYHPLREGDMVGLAGTRLICYHPLRETAGTNDRETANDDANAGSLAFALDIGARRVFFTGDLPGPILDDLAARYGERLKSSILKIPHHGSRHSLSADFLDACRPRQAVITAGRNAFGHPDRRWLDQLEAKGAEAMITGRDGSIEFSYSGTASRTLLWDGRSGLIPPGGIWRWLFQGG